MSSRSVGRVSASVPERDSGVFDQEWIKASPYGDQWHRALVSRSSSARCDGRTFFSPNRLFQAPRNLHLICGACR
jgi:hypothetical protein